MDFEKIMKEEDKDKKKKKKKMTDEVVKENSLSTSGSDSKEEIGLQDVLADEDVALPSSPSLIARLKESVFEEGIHYIIQERKGQETVFFKKQASSVLAELFSVNIKIISTKVESYIPPATKLVVDKVFDSIQSLIVESKMKTAGSLLEWVKDLTNDKNPAEWWRAEVCLEADNNKRKLQWIGSATSALENVALSTAATRAFRNLIRIFGGL